MNIEDILNKLTYSDKLIFEDNIGYLNTFYIPLKKFLLYKLLNNCSITKYNNIVRYFLSTNINKLTSFDINFKDSLENKQIVYILLNVLNDTNICDYYNTNQIIILDNINLFNKLIPFKDSDNTTNTETNTETNTDTNTETNTDTNKLILTNIKLL